MSNFDFIDLHCDTLMSLYMGKKNLWDNSGHINLQKLIKGNSYLQSFAIFTPTHLPKEAAEQMGGLKLEDPYPFFIHMCETFYRQMEANKEYIRPVRSYTDILKNKEGGYISALLTMEDGVMITDLDLLKKAYDSGVRMIALTWNWENSIGYPNSTDPQKHMLPLKPFGIEVIKKMNELGIIIDVSHLSEGGFWDIVNYSDKPFIASHSCARALCSHQRNLTDKQLEALGKAGGVCGVNFNAPFLNDNSNCSTIEDVVRHARYIADKAGMDAVALGSDFDGISCELEFEDYVGMNGIKEALVKEFGSSDTDKICHQNALRVIQEVIG